MATGSPMGYTYSYELRIQPVTLEDLTVIAHSSYSSSYDKTLSLTDFTLKDDYLVWTFSTSYGEYVIGSYDVSSTGYVSQVGITANSSSNSPTVVVPSVTIDDDTTTSTTDDDSSTYNLVVLEELNPKQYISEIQIPDDENYIVKDKNAYTKTEIDTILTNIKVEYNNTYATVTTPFQTFKAKKGQTLAASGIYPIGYSDSRYTLTAINNYKLSGTIIDINSYVVEKDITLTCGYKLAGAFAAGSSTYRITYGSCNSTIGSSVWVYKGYYSSECGSYVSGNAFGCKPNIYTERIPLSSGYYYYAGADLRGISGYAKCNVRLYATIAGQLWQTTATWAWILSPSITSQNMFNSMPTSGTYSITFYAEIPSAYQ